MNFPPGEQMRVMSNSGMDLLGLNLPTITHPIQPVC